MKSQRRGPGRPAKPEGEKNITIAVTVQPALVEYAREIGEGNLSRGVQRALGESLEARMKKALRKKKGKAH